MKPNEIRAELLLQNIKCVDIAESLGISKQYLSGTINFRNKTSYVREAIAKAIGKPVEEVFSESETKEVA